MRLAAFRRKCPHTACAACPHALGHSALWRWHCYRRARIAHTHAHTANPIGTATSDSWRSFSKSQRVLMLDRSHRLVASTDSVRADQSGPVVFTPCAFRAIVPSGSSMILDLSEREKEASMGNQEDTSSAHTKREREREREREKYEAS